MKQLWKYFLFLTLILFPIAVYAQSDSPPVTLRLRRNFGYGGFKQIQGTFTMTASSDQTLTRVEFLLDGEVVALDEAAPFEFQFNTGDYPEGGHTLSAVGYTPAGEALPSNSYTREFLSSEAAWGAARGLIGPLLVIVLGITALSTLGPLLLGRRRAHRPGVYGAAGGAICPRCTFPYSRNFLSLNLLAGKLERCPHCGKWALVRRASPQDLAAAEERLAAEGEVAVDPADSEDERLRRMLEDSRFEP